MENRPLLAIRRSRGLTLVELLVAISILAVVAVLGWRGLDSIIRSRAALTDDIEQVRSMQLTFAQMQRDCEQLARATALNSRTVLSVGNNSLTLVRNVVAENQPLQLQVVSYRLLDGKLLRGESASTRNLRDLDALWRSAVDGDAAVVVLQAGVAGMNFRYWPGNADGWRSLPSGALTLPAAASGMPTGLEVTLQPAGRDVTVKAMLLGAA
ncbi:MAG: prepilin-type N-terminal cleavage/methylation protein [Burkholderiaceae bacterium]|nr:prepilin-type N-terminal cleavage/methylation protein [Burkholderiaceae bacterium]